MCVCLKLLSILTSISLCLVSVSAKAKVKYGPTGMSFQDYISCEEFSKYGRFNPYSVLYQTWFVFFFWAPVVTIRTYVFTFPTANHTKHLHKIFDRKTIIPIDWSARQILMENQKKEIYLLIERGDRGQYWMYPVLRVKGQKLKPRDIRLKQTADNRLLGYMDCDQGIVYAMSKIEEVPPKHKLLDEATRLGYRSRRGKSYLYQGHEWMPIPEDDEDNYWQRKNTPHKGWVMRPNEPESSKRPNEEKKSQPAQEPEKSETVNKAQELQLTNNDEKNESRTAEVNTESSTDQVHLNLYNEPRNEKLTNEQQDKQDTNIRETTQSTDAICSGYDKCASNKDPVTNMGEELENTSLKDVEQHPVNNQAMCKAHDKCASNKEKEKNSVEEPDKNSAKELEKHESTTERGNVPTTSEPAKLKSSTNKQEENDATKQPTNCYECYESAYIKSTDKPYISESTQSTNILDLKNNLLKNEPVTPQTSKESHSNKQDVGTQSYSEPTPTPETLREPPNFEFDSLDNDWQAMGEQ